MIGVVRTCVLLVVRRDIVRPPELSRVEILRAQAC